MPLFRRGADNDNRNDDNREPHAGPAGAGPAGADDEDSPAALRARLWELVKFVNGHAGRLPVDAVVTAREITDTIRELIDAAEESADGRELDVYTVVSINGIIGDYMPTTLRAYLNLDPDLTGRVGPSGRTPRAALGDQLDALADAAADLLQATRQHDVDAVFTQGNFLRTKFTRSDLDL